MLVITALVASFFLLVNFAIAGEKWAIGLSVGIAAIPGFFFAYALTFSFAYFLTRTTTFGKPKISPSSPFTTDELPPQILSPSDDGAVE